MAGNIEVWRLRHAGIVLLLALSGTVAVAQTQVQMNESAANSLKAVIEELDQAISDYRRRLPKDQLALFEKSQQAWVQYRHAACTFQSSGVNGGSARPMIEAACLEVLSRERLRDIKRLSQCGEGDLSCPAWRKDSK